MENLKKTALHSLHVQQHAKMLAFGAWDMPIHYGSQIQEHMAVRQNIGIFDVSHMCIVDVHARGVTSAALHFFKRVLANNVEKLALNQALYTCMLYDNGGIVDDLIIYRLSDTHYRLVLNAGCEEKDLAWLRQQQENHKPDMPVDIVVRRDWSMLAIQGPQSSVWLSTYFGVSALANIKPFTAHLLPDDAGMVARTGYTGEDGYEVMLPHAQAVALWESAMAHQIQACGLGARDTLRLEAGMHLYGQDMDATINPLNCGLAWTVDMRTARDFIGRQALEKTPTSTQLLGVYMAQGGILRAHQKVFTRLGEGEITSGSYSPSLQHAIGFVRVPVGLALGEVIEVEIRQNRVPATLSKMSFVRKGKILLESL